MNPNLPVDGNSKGLPLTPAKVAVAITYDTTISSDTTVTLNAATTFIEVNAISQGIFMKWGATATSSAFDEYIQAGSTRHYVVPKDAAGLRYTTAHFIEQASAATLLVIEK